MAEAKTRPTNQSVASFIKKIPDPQTREDCFAIARLMKEATSSEPRMWGSAIVGFGTQHYKYASGREGDWPLIGFSPRKQNLTLTSCRALTVTPNSLKSLVSTKSAGAVCTSKVSQTSISPR